MSIEALWVAERPKVVANLRRYVSRAVALDIADEAFAAAIREGTDCPAHIWRLAWSGLATLQRRRSVHKRVLKGAEVVFGTAVPGIETAIIRADFDRAFRKLAHDLATSFALTELRGLTEREAAEVLGVSQPTVHRRAEAARIYLQKELS